MRTITCDKHCEDFLSKGLIFCQIKLPPVIAGFHGNNPAFSDQCQSPYLQSLTKLANHFPCLCLPAVSQQQDLLVQCRAFVDQGQPVVNCIICETSQHFLTVGASIIKGLIFIQKEVCSWKLQDTLLCYIILYHFMLSC